MKENQVFCNNCGAKVERKGATEQTIANGQSGKSSQSAQPGHPTQPTQPGQSEQPVKSGQPTNSGPTAQSNQLNQQTQSAQQAQRNRATNPTQPVQQTRSDSKPNSFFQSKKSKIIALIVVILAAAGFTGYKVLSSMYEPTKIVEKFEKAIDKDDAKGLANLLNSGQDNMEVTEGDAKSLLAYLEDNPDLLDETKDNLHKEAQAFTNDKIIDAESHDYFNLVALPKKWGIIKQYGISFKSIYLKITSNQPDTSVTIDGKEQEKLKENDEKTFGPFLPIEHVVKGLIKAEYTSVTDEVEVNPFDYENSKIAVELNLTGEEIYLWSNYDDAVVFINGKTTAKSVRELATLGPVPVDGSMKIHAEKKISGKLLKSEEVSISEGNKEYELYIDDSVIQAEALAAEEAKQEVESAVYDHYSYISSGDYSSAYDLFSASRQGKINYEKWKDGLIDNYSNEVVVKTDSVKGDKAVASFELISRDYSEDGTLVQTFSGKWNLVKEFTGWKLDTPKISKTGERTE
nr:hypothetical protein [Bacillus massilionigeriensis]